MTSPPEGRRFRPALRPTLITVPAVALLLGLGTWQVHRLQWKTDLNAMLDARLTAPPVALEAALADPEAHEFRRARVTGRFQHEGEMHLGPRTFRSRPGSHVITPLALADGGAILVDRGWVPHDRREPTTRSAGQVAGTVTVEGVLRRDRRSAWFTPENRPAEGAWAYVDVAAMAAAAGVTASPGLYLEAGAAPNPGGLPVGGQTRVELRNPHLQYALTWYALAAVLVVIYILSQRHRPH